MPKIPFRHLKGYSLDPGFSTRLDTASVNEITYAIRWEENLTKGPCGNYFEVVDWDPASDCFYDPVDLNSIEVLAQNGLAPSEGNPKFHQQFVYTIAMKTLEHFEYSLGRKLIWAPRRLPRNPDDKNAPRTEYIDKIRIYPHALRDANAFYDIEKKAIMFGYFEAAAKVEGSNLPGGVIFSCLSPDIVAHEVTHAILDSIHPRFTENTNPDVPAFHEGFADIVALLQRFTIKELIEHQIAQTSGDLGKFSFLGELATQFGNALESSRGALRGAIGKFDKEKNQWVKYEPDPSRYKTVFEPHQRGALLVATIFDAFLRLYNSTTADLLRIASNGTGILQPGAIHPDLVKRLAAAACEIAQRLLHICIRALDYCPPVDITFGDYLRALITADLDSNPRDENGYRLALIEAFRSWGIFPDRVNTLSIESLQWSSSLLGINKEEEEALQYVARFLKRNLRSVIEKSTLDKENRAEIDKASRFVQGKLQRLLMGEKRKAMGEAVWSGFLQKLGLTDKPVEFLYENEHFKSETAPPLEVHRIRHVNRVGREGKVLDQVIITLTQTFRIESGSLQGAKFRGGCTLVLNLSRGFDVQYIIYKNVNSSNRFKFQMDYQTGKSNAFVALSDSMYEEESGFGAINFAHLHFHNL
jgi:hypothetical protein